MFDNFPVPSGNPKKGKWAIRGDVECLGQIEDAMEFVMGGGFAPLLGSPASPIVCVRGNHDFIDLSPLFEGCNLVHEFIDNEVVEVLGKRITGHRGIPYIHGTWSDEMTRESLRLKLDAMPDADIFLTHYPPAGILDSEISRGIEMGYGMEGMREALARRMGDRGLHCFGHIHGSGGSVREFGPGQFFGQVGHLHTYSNAACNVNVIEV